MGIGDIKGLFIGIIFGVIILGSGIMFMSTFFSSDNTIDSKGDINSFNNTYAQSVAGLDSSISNLNNSIGALSNKNAGLVGVFDVLIGSVTTALTAITSSLGFVNIVLYQMAFWLHIPVFIIGLFLSIVIVIIAFAIIAAIMRVNE